MRRPMLVGTLLAWVGVGAFWFAATQDFHPTRPLAGIVTTSLVVAYAVAAYANHLILIPRYWRSRRFARYGCWLGGSMVTLTALALAVIRVAYFRLWGPDPDPYGVPRHFAIDLSGMAAHLIAAALVVWVAARVSQPRGESGDPARETLG